MKKEKGGHRGGELDGKTGALKVKEEGRKKSKTAGLSWMGSLLRNLLG